MRILITGSRDWTDRVTISRTILRYMNERLPMIYEDHIPIRRDWSDVVIVHGAARGADLLAAEWAEGCDPPIKTESHPVTRADWRARPQIAGYLRNIHMVSLGADVCMGFIKPCRKPDCPRLEPHGSHGASHTTDLADSVGIETIRVTQ